MSIKDQIETVSREFVGGDILLCAVLTQEDVSPYQVASWFMRWIKHLDSIPMIAYNAERQDFYPIEHPWAGDVFTDIIHEFDPEGVSWDENNDGYIGGWLSSDLERFFASTGVSYPGAAIANLERVSRSRADAEGRSSSAEQGRKPPPGVEIEQPSSETKKDAAAVDTPIGTRERNTLLSIIATLAKEAGIALDQPSKAAESIANAAQLQGLTIARRTIEEKLKLIPDAIAARGK
ncbi:hypothetical protein [Methylibium sp.]|uniref:hypothetical protein n=1 Tax=Methylibium sp. TaxID=2067992 RepID=UPI001800F37A|nr:hypothetical protein [Methylibium sp.]MBA3590634.1 hypothetical protein [Methylibium sp.]